MFKCETCGQEFARDWDYIKHLEIEVKKEQNKRIKEAEKVELSKYWQEHKEERNMIYLSNVELWVILELIQMIQQQDLPKHSQKLLKKLFKRFDKLLFKKEYFKLNYLKEKYGREVYSIIRNPISAQEILEMFSEEKILEIKE